MSTRPLDRILRQTGASGLLDTLTERLSPADLNTLLLEVYRRRAAGVTPGRLLDAYRRGRLTAPTRLATPAELAALDVLVHERLPAHGFTSLALSPLAPLGACAALAGLDQDRVVSTARRGEVVSDITNVLALECATRRGELLRAAPRSRERVRLGATHRVLRPESSVHFALLGLCTAGRDEGSFRFETAALTSHLGLHLDLLSRARGLGLRVGAIEVRLTDLSGGTRRAALDGQVREPLAAAHPDVTVRFDDDRPQGRGYYADACFEIRAAAPAAGEQVSLVDGGLTRWTAALLSNAKERLLISGLGLERLVSACREASPSNMPSPGFRAPAG